MNIYSTVLEKLNAGERVVLLTSLDGAEGTGQPGKACFTEADLEAAHPGGGPRPEAAQLVRWAMATGEVQLLTTPDGRMLVAEPLFPQPRLIIFGGGHIGKALCHFASRAGFLVTVVDDRIEFANRERFPDADQVICDSFDRSFERLRFGPQAYVVLVTRGHRHDTACLREVVKRKWAYAGMTGSRRRVQGVKELLISEGADREVVQKVNAPIGLDIGAITPEEITIAILAQVISYRRLEQPKLGRESARLKWTEFDREVIEELARGGGSRAVATVISSGGSTPREAGAKMVVWPEGRILGSVGGGGGEAAVIQSAREVMRRGGHLVQAIDMTGGFNDDGMVCGGSMRVLIEPVQGHAGHRAAGGQRP